jgi:outer membrane protein
MQGLGWLGGALLALVFACHPPSVWGQQFWGSDPFKAMGNVSPEPGVAWEPRKPLPAVSAPESMPAPETNAPLTLAELTEYAPRAAAAGVGIEQADYLPQLTGGFGVTRIRPISGTTGTVSPPQTRFGPTVSLSYIVFDAARGDQVEAAEYRLLAANLNQNRVLQDIIFQVEQAYYRLLGLELLVSVNEVGLQNLRTSLDAAQRRRESGLATVADVYRAETQVAQADVILIRSRGEFEKARGQLASAVGLPVNQTLRVQTFAELPQIRQLMASVMELIEHARTTRPDIVASEAQSRAARSTAEAASKATLPTLELSATAGGTATAQRGSVTDFRPLVTNYAFGLNLRFPIFTGFRDRYSVLQAQALAQQADASRDTLYRQTELDVWQAFYDVQTAAGGVGSTEAQVKSAEQTAQATLARYKAGFGSILDLITAQQDESNARVQRIQSYLDWYTALARLQFSTGFSDIIAAASGRK